MIYFASIYIGAAAGFVVGAIAMMVSMSISPSNVDWAGPLMAVMVIAGACIGGAIGACNDRS